MKKVEILKRSGCIWGCSLMLFLFGCKDPNGTGIDVLPENSLIEAAYTDTIYLDVRPHFIDSVYSQNQDITMLGNYLDPQFGWIFASTYSQFRLKANNISFGDNPDSLLLDSIVLNLDVGGFYNKFDERLELLVYELTESFPESDSLYTTDSLAYDASLNLAGNKAIDFNGLGGFLDYTSIRLDDSLGRKLLLASAQDLATNDAFTDFFKGLYISAKPVAVNGSREPGSIYYLNILGVNTSLQLHYHDGNRKKIYSFDVDPNAERFYSLKRTAYHGKLLETILTEANDPSPTYSVLSAAGLIETRVFIPEVQNLPYLGLHKAEIVLKVDEQYVGQDLNLGTGNPEYTLAPPPSLSLAFLDENGQATTAFEPLSGQQPYDPETFEYRINVTTSLSGIISGQVDAAGYAIRPDLPMETLNRAVIGAQGHPSLKPLMRVIYTQEEE